jgi:uncharacterized protein (UPF0332 family)
MPQLLKKSNENFQAAQFLLKKNLYASSIHCSYYSCFQRVKHCLNTKYNIAYASMGWSKVHSQLPIKLYKNIKSNNHLSTVELSILRRHIDKCKYFRLMSDYEPTSIDFARAKNTHTLCKKTHHLLSKI